VDARAGARRTGGPVRGGRAGDALGDRGGGAPGPAARRAWALTRSVHDPSLPACEERRRILVERLVAEDYPGFARAITRSLVGSIAAGRQPLAQLTQPTLLVWGRNDRLVALSGSRRVLRALPHARLAVLERCGHLPMLEQPQQFNRAVADFLRTVEAAPLTRARRATGTA